MATWLKIILRQNACPHFLSNTLLAFPTKSSDEVEKYVMTISFQSEGVLHWGDSVQLLVEKRESEMASLFCKKGSEGRNSSRFHLSPLQYIHIFCSGI